MPGANLLNAYKARTVNELEYTKIYLDRLDARKEQIIDVLNALPDKAVLICYEKPGEFCQEDPARDWIGKNCPNITIKER